MTSHRTAGALAAVLLAALLTGCSSIQFFVANVGASSKGVARQVDLSYGLGPRRQLDVYAAGTPAKRPVVIFWYGGSWETGQKKDYRFVGTTLAEWGYVVVIPDYPLFPAAHFPQFEVDGAAVIAWAVKHIAAYGGDPRNIVLMGHSAGAHTAAFLAYDRAFDVEQGVDPTVLRGFIGLSGPYELVPDSVNLRAAFAAPYSESDWQPIRFVDVQAPPSLLLHGTSDREVLPRESMDLADALSRSHVPVELHLYPHRRHGATVAPFSRALRWRTPVLEVCARFLGRVTGSPAPSIDHR